MADINAEGGQAEGRDADEGGRGQDANFKAGEGHADGKSVDTRGNGHHKHGLDAEIVIEFLRLGEGFLDHVHADYREQAEGDPMVKACDDMLKARAEKPADDGHEKLEAAEVRAGNKRVLYTELLHAQPLADGHGECIHAQADGDKQQFNKTH